MGTIERRPVQLFPASFYSYRIVRTEIIISGLAALGYIAI